MAALAPADGLGVHDLEVLAQLDDAVLVDAGLMAEGVEADDGLVGLDVHAGVVGDHAGERDEVLGVDAALDIEEVGAGLDAHDDLFEGSVAGALADAVDGALDLAGAGGGGGEAVGGAEAEIVVAVNGKGDGVDALDVLEDAVDELGELLRDGVADGVGDVDGGGAGRDALAEETIGEVGVGAGGVHGAELDVGDVALGLGDHLARLLEHFLAAGAELVRDVNVGAADEDVEAGVFGVLDGGPPLLDIVGDGAAEGGDGGAADFVGDAGDGVEVGGTGGGEAGLDAVDVELLQHLGDLELLVVGEGDAGGLLAVSERGVEDLDSVRHGGAPPWGTRGRERKGAPRRRFAATSASCG